MAVTTDQKITRLGSPGDSTQPLELPCKAATTFYRGTPATTRAGYLVEATAPASTDVVWGMIEDMGSAANLTVSGPGFVSPSGADGQIKARIATGAFYMASSTGADAITEANVGATVYLADETHVALTSAGGTRPVAGVVLNIDSTQPGGVAVKFGSNQSSGAPS
jgi:hypothetical protein